MPILPVWTKLPKVDVTAKPGTLFKENGSLKLVIEFTNPSTSLAFGLNPKLLSVSTREPILPVFWQDNYFSLLPGEKRTIEMQVDASLVTEGKLLFKLDGWNLKTVQEQELTMPEKKEIFEAEKAELIGGASKVPDKSASGGYLVSLAKPGQGLKFDKPP